MRDAIFLSASVPDPERAPEFARTADSVAITSAVSALLFVTLGRRPLVWGGHPAITPMVWEVARSMELDYGTWVKLYQSKHWEDKFPEDNDRFGNVTYTPDINHDRERSLRLMRQTMFRENEFIAAVFIGGMKGILDEYELFRERQPQAKLLPVASTGGAAATLVGPDVRIEEELDYVRFFHQRLDVSPRERRYRTPVEQPREIQRRFDY